MLILKLILITSGYFLHIGAITSANRSIPFRKVSLEMATILIVFNGNLLEGSGLNRNVSTALGITEIRFGFNDALKDKFSLLAWETDITASISDKKNLRTVLIWMQAASENPNNEWSVYTVLYPIVLECKIDSNPNTEVAF